MQFNALIAAIALRRQNTEAQAAQPVASGVDLANVNFRNAIEGDRATWRPLRAFDDGRQVFIEFPRGIGQGEMPPLFVVGPEGNTSGNGWRPRTGRGGQGARKGLRS